MATPGNHAADRADSYAPLREYAAIGDGRTIALVALDGSIDWLCLPDLDSPAALGALLDAGSGGGFALCPVSPFVAERRYLPGTNVLETTFRTSSGVARVFDAMTLPGRDLSPQREVVRAVEAVAGSVSMRWCLTPRFGFGSRPTRIGRRAGAPVATQGADAVALCSWGAGGPELTVGSIGGVRCHRRGAGSVRAERCSPGTARDSQPTRRRAQTGGDGIGVAALVRKPATWD